MAINPYSGTLAIVGTVVRGFGNGAIFACGFALSAQVVDYGEWKFNVRSEGLVNSCVSFGQKVGLEQLSQAGSSQPVDMWELQKYRQHLLTQPSSLHMYGLA